MNDAAISPRPYQKMLPIWIGVGGTPESAARAGRLGLNMALGILGGDPARVKPLVDIYRAAGRAAGHDSSKLRVSVTGHSYIAKTSQQALDEFHPHYVNYFSCFMKERGQRFWVSRSDLDPMTAPNNVLAVVVHSNSLKKYCISTSYFATAVLWANLTWMGNRY